MNISTETNVSHVSDFISYQIRDELNNLKSDEKLIRLNAIKTLVRKMNGIESKFSKDEYFDLVSNIYKSILKLFVDPSEQCREHAVNLFISFVSNCSNFNEHLTYLFPILVQRLGTIDKELIETSEEVRLLEIKLISLIVDCYKDSLLSYIDDITLILKHLIIDPYPEVKKESCNCAVNLSIALKKHFYYKSDDLINPLLKTLSHQHSKVRCAAVKALKIVILNGSNKMVNEVIPHLAQRLFDASPLVRQEINLLIGTWLVELPDRYSFFSKLIPLCLSLLDDEVEEVSQVARKYWLLAGDTYLNENEQEYKDQIDFEQQPEYPDNLAVPSQGCRFLVQRHTFYIIPGIVNDLNDWNEGTRKKVSQLLLPLVLHSEAKISSYIEKLLPALISAAKDPDLLMNIKKCAYYIGFFVDSGVWMKVMGAYLALSPGANHFVILACLIHGSRLLSDDCVATLCEKLVEHSKDSSEFLPAIENCVENLLHKPRVPGFPMFLLITTCQAHGSPNADALFEALASYLELDSPQQLYTQYLKDALCAIKEDLLLWTINSSNFLIFIKLLQNLYLDLPQSYDLAFGILEELSRTSSDAKLKLRLFTTLAAILPNLEKHWSLTGILEKGTKFLISSVILPNLEWKAGLTASALRNAVVVSLWSIVDNLALGSQLLQQEGDHLFTQLTSLLEDEVVLTRKYTILCLTKLYPALSPHVEPLRLIHIYPEVIKRLDDVHREIRLLAAHFFPIYFTHFPGGFDIAHHQTFCEEILRGLLIHLDDSDKEFQNEILEVLKLIAPNCPGLLLQLTEEVQHKHRTPHYCSLLRSHLLALGKSSC